MNLHNKALRTQLYQEEFDFIFQNKGSGVRKVTVMSALIEVQVFLLAESFLKSKGVKHSPTDRNKYFQSLEVLKANSIINSELTIKIEEFRKKRNKSIHKIFTMNRQEWDAHNKNVIEFGRPIIKALDEILYLDH